MLHLPPPVHGSSLVGEAIKNSKVLGNNFHGSYLNLLLSKTVRETGKAGLLKVFRFLSIWHKLFFKLVFQKPDLCYYALSTTGFAFMKDSMMIVLLHMFRVRTVFHLHNKGVSVNKDRRLYDSLYRFVFKDANVILLSEHLYYDIEKYVSPNRTYYCPNGVDACDFNEAHQETRKDGFFKILFLSNLIHAKGVYDLIDACAILQGKGFKFRCEFVGGEGDISRIQFDEYVERKGLSENVRYLGKKYGFSKDVIFMQSDLFVLPTHNDCFPLVVIEAMQHGLPIISTYQGGIPDMIDDGITGYLIPQGEVSQMAGRIESLMQNPALRMEMGENGRKKYEECYTLEKFEEKMSSILQEELNKTD